MPERPKKHISPWIAWSMVALFAGIAGYCIYYYWDQVDTAWDNISYSVAKKNTTKESTPTTTTSATDEKKTACEQLFPNYLYRTSLDQKNGKTGDNFCLVEKLQGNYAEGIEGGIVSDTGESGPGAHWLAMKKNNTWTKLQTTQDAWDCIILRENSVPKTILGNDKTILGNDTTCYNSTTKQTETY